MTRQAVYRLLDIHIPFFYMLCSVNTSAAAAAAASFASAASVSCVSVLSRRVMLKALCVVPAFFGAFPRRLSLEKARFHETQTISSLVIRCPYSLSLFSSFTPR